VRLSLAKVSLPLASRSQPKEEGRRREKGGKKRKKFKIF